MTFVDTIDFKLISSHTQYFIDQNPSINKWKQIGCFMEGNCSRKTQILIGVIQEVDHIKSIVDNQSTKNNWIMCSIEFKNSTIDSTWIS